MTAQSFFLAIVIGIMIYYTFVFEGWFKYIVAIMGAITAYTMGRFDAIQD